MRVTRGPGRAQSILAGKSANSPVAQAASRVPADPYLLWLDGQGHVSLLCPSRDHKFGGRLSGDSAPVTVDCPGGPDEGLTTPVPGGLETVLLLVRRTPLPPGIDLAASIVRKAVRFAYRGK